MSVLERFERAVFAVMGPAQVGDVNAPLRALPPRAPDLCPDCGQERDTHEVVREPRLTYTVCPARGVPVLPPAAAQRLP